MKRKTGENEEKSREKWRGEVGEKEKKKERENLTDIGLVCGSHKQLKNIEWWQVSDGAKWGRVLGVGYFKWWVMSNGNWVMKKKHPNKLTHLTIREI